MGKLYDVYFTLAESANMVIEADNEEDAEDILCLIPNIQIIDRVQDVIAYKGIVVTRIDELEDKMSKARELAIDILEMFEDILDEHGIKVPDEDRMGDENEAALYGTTYANLEDELAALLSDYVNE